MKPPRFRIIAVVGLLVASVCVPMIRSSGDQGDAVRARFDDLQIALDAYVPRHARNPAYRPGLDDQLREAHRRMEEVPITQDLGTLEGVGYPFQWAQEYRPALRAELAARSEFFGTVEALCAAASDPNRAPAEARPDQIPSLLACRDVANLYCARAICALDGGGGEEEAIRLLETAFAVMDFCDSGHLISLMIRQAIESIVLGAVINIVHEHGSCPPEIASFVRERFPPTVDRDRLALTLRRELEFMAPYMKGRDLEAMPGVEPWKLLASHLDDYEAALALLDQPPAAVANTDGSRAIVNAKAWNLRTRWLAQLALALDARLAAGRPWPSSLDELAAALDPALRPPPAVLAHFALEVRPDGRWLHLAAKDLPPDFTPSSSHWRWR